MRLGNNGSNGEHAIEGGMISIAWEAHIVDKYRIDIRGYFAQEAMQQATLDKLEFCGLQ